MAFGIDDALMIGTILASLFGKGGKQQQTTTTEQANPNYQSPLLGMMDPLIASMLVNNSQALGGAGMPGGVSRFGSSSGTMMNDILSLLQNEWPNISKGYAGKSSADCEGKCRETYAQNTAAPDALKKFQECKAKCGASS